MPKAKVRRQIVLGLSRCGRKRVVVMARYFVSTDWRVPMTALLIALFFTVPLFLVAYKLGLHVRDDYYLPRITEQTLKKRGDAKNPPERSSPRQDYSQVGQQWGSANCGENFESGLQEDQWILPKELTEEALSQIRADRLRTCRELGYRD
jgi:hypothetical protein